jgi:hypothetical protein
MKLIQVIIYLNFLITLSSITVKPKLCIDCKFLQKIFLIVMNLENVKYILKR